MTRNPANGFRQQASRVEDTTTRFWYGPIIMHGRILLAAATLLASVLGCTSGDPRPIPTTPNLLLVSIDTLRADRVGAYGAKHNDTPVLDSLARGGTLYEHTTSATPITLPSHATMFTGLLPPRHGARHNGTYYLAEEIPTLAEALHAVGYDTGAVIASIVLAKRHGLDRGFDVYDDAIDRAKAERRADEVNRLAIDWLNRARERPFFLFVHYYDPHAIYDPPADWAQRFPGRPYDAEVSYVDSELGRLLETLHRKDTLGRTLVVVTSDHGESLGEHHESTHGFTLYDASLAVPLIFAGPGVPTGRRIATGVGSADLTPTILSYLGIEPFADLDGRDLSVGWEEGAEAPTRPPVYAEAVGPSIVHGWSPLFAARNDEFLYVRAPRPELYRLCDDPSQVRNLLAAPRSDLERVVDELDGRIDDVLRRARPGKRISLYGETAERLAALGYVVSDATEFPDTGIDPKHALAWKESFQRARNRAPATETKSRPEIAEIRRKAVLGDLDAARQITDRLIERHAGDAALIQELADAWGGMAMQFETARELNERALEQNPELESAHRALALHYLRKGQDERASRHREKAGASWDKADTQMNAASVYAWRGNHARAAAIWKSLLERDPQVAAAEINGHGTGRVAVGTARADP